MISYLPFFSSRKYCPKINFERVLLNLASRFVWFYFVYCEEIFCVGFPGNTESRAEQWRLSLPSSRHLSYTSYNQSHHKREFNIELQSLRVSCIFYPLKGKFVCKRYTRNQTMSTMIVFCAFFAVAKSEPNLT